LIDIATPDISLLLRRAACAMSVDAMPLLCFARCAIRVPRRYFCRIDGVAASRHCRYRHAASAPCRCSMLRLRTCAARRAIAAIAARMRPLLRRCCRALLCARLCAYLLSLKRYAAPDMRRYAADPRHRHEPCRRFFTLLPPYAAAAACFSLFSPRHAYAPRCWLMLADMPRARERGGV